MDNFLEILGCGSSIGSPAIGCSCPTCTSTSPFNKRLRTSARVHINSKNYLIDASPDLRQQALRANFSSIEAVFYTHAHADHIMGMDDLRAFFFKNKKSIKIFTSKETEKEIIKSFAYIFNRSEKYKGSLPEIEVVNFTPGEILKIDDLNIQSIPVLHGGLEVAAFCFGNISYVTDVNEISNSSLDLIKDSEIIIIGALEKNTHFSHFSFAEAIEVIQKTKAKKAYFTHISHLIDYSNCPVVLPSNIELCFDGLKIPIKL